MSGGQQFFIWPIQPWQLRHTMLSPDKNSFNDRFIHHYNSWFIHRRPFIQELVAAAQLKPHETVVNIGSGLGWVAQMAAPQCKFVLSVDDDPKTYRVAPTLAEHTHNCRFVSINLLKVEHEYQKLGYQIAERVDTCPCTPHRFDVALITLLKPLEYGPGSYVDLFKMLKERILKPAGRIVVDYEAPYKEVQTIEVVYGIERPGETRISPWHSWRKEMVGSQESVGHARESLMEVAMSSGWDARSLAGFTETEQGYTDVTNEIVDATRARTSDPDILSSYWTTHEFSRQTRLNYLEEEFTKSDQFPIAQEGEQIHFGARFKPASVIGVLVQQVQADSLNGKTTQCEHEIAEGRMGGQADQSEK